MPKFTVLLQTSPTGEPGKFVNSLPPVKSPREPLASGDTVPETWSMEVATLEEVTALIHKELESLTARVEALEAKLGGGEKSKEAKEQKRPVDAKPASDKTEPDKADEKGVDSAKKDQSENGRGKAAKGKTEESKRAPAQKPQPKGESTVKK